MPFLTKDNDMTKYKHLFEPIQIGKKTVKNRIFMPPISTNLANKGYVTEELIQHYGARARGGVGLIVSEVVTVEPTYIYLPGDMSIHDDSYIEGWKKLYDEVHKYGTVLLPQLFHPAYMAFPIPGTPQKVMFIWLSTQLIKSANISFSQNRSANAVSALIRITGGVFRILMLRPERATDSCKIVTRSSLVSASNSGFRLLN